MAGEYNGTPLHTSNSRQSQAIDAPAPATPRATRSSSLRKPRTSPSKSKSLPQLPRGAISRSTSPFARNQPGNERCHSQPAVSPRSPGSTTSCQNSASGCGSTDSHTALISRNNSTARPSLTVPSSFPKGIQLSPETRQRGILTKQVSSPNMHDCLAAEPRDSRTTKAMSPRARRQLIRSTRKLSKILGETPVLPGSLDSEEWVDCADEEELSLAPQGRPAAHSLSLRQPISPTSAARAALTFGMTRNNLSCHTLGSRSRAGSRESVDS